MEVALLLVQEESAHIVLQPIEVKTSTIPCPLVTLPTNRVLPMVLSVDDKLEWRSVNKIKINV